MNVGELKALLRAQQLPVSGLKRELVDRLFKEGVAVAAVAVPPHPRSAVRLILALRWCKCRRRELYKPMHNKKRVGLDGVQCVAS